MESSERGWHLIEVFDLVALVLTCVVVIRAIGGLIAAVGVNQAYLGNSTYTRLAYGTQWADLVSGLLLLASLAVIALPRMVWEAPNGSRWTEIAPKLLAAIGVVALLTAVASVLGTLNWLGHSSNLNLSGQATTVSEGVGAVTLSVMTALLTWFAQPFVRQPESTEAPA